MTALFAQTASRSARGHRRKLRRVAYLLFPREVFREEVIAQIAAEGYHEVAIGLIQSEGSMGNFVEQGFTLDKAVQLHDWAYAHGLSSMVFTGYMKYEEPLIAREPQRAMVTYGSQRRLDSDGMASPWLCPFRPENLERYFTMLLEPITQWRGLRELHLNDEAFLGFQSGAIGCYCDHCRADYQRKAGSPPPTQADWNDPQWWRWIEYRLRRWTQVHAELRQRIKALRPDVIVGIQHSPIAPLFAWNPWKTAIDLGRDARALDLLSTDPYQWQHMDVVTLRPHRRLLTEGTRGLLGATLHDRAATIYPQGFMPPKSSVPMTRQDGLLAGVIPFAMGADCVSPFTYELMKIIPGYHEAWQDARKLMPLIERLTPDPFVTVVAPIQSETFGHPDQDWCATYLTHLADVMYHAGLPWRWCWDNRLEDAADQLRGPIIVPDAHCLTAGQLEVIRNVARRGEGVLWLGNMPQGAWPGEGGCPVPAPLVEQATDLELNADSHPLLEGLTKPVVLERYAAAPPWPGTVLACIGAEPGLILREGEAWLAGAPKLNPVRSQVGGIVRRFADTIKLFRRLILSLAMRQPTLRLDPWPPLSDYDRIRPWDLRGIPTAELFPMSGEDGALAIVFPYTPVGFDTNLLIAPPEGRQMRCVRELWEDVDCTGQLQRHAADWRLPLRFGGDCELKAFFVEWS